MTSHSKDVGEFTVVPYDGEKAIIRDDLLSGLRQESNILTHDLVNRKRPVWLEIEDHPVLVHAERGILKRTIALPREKYEELGYDGVAEDNQYVSVYKGSRSTG